MRVSYVGQRDPSCASVPGFLGCGVPHRSLTAAGLRLPALNRRSKQGELHAKN